MNIKKTLLTALFCMLVVAGCGGGDSDSPTSTPNIGNFTQPAIQNSTPRVTQTTLRSFSVAGTSASPSGDPTPINPAENNGEFKISWDAAAPSGIYHGRVYLSSDTVLERNGDWHFFGINCGLGVSTLSGCGETGDFTCSFDNDLTLGCDQGAQRRRIDGFLDQIPKNAYFILEVCDASFRDCLIDYIPIQIQ